MKDIFLHGGDLIFASKAMALTEAAGGRLKMLRGAGPFEGIDGRAVFVNLAGVPAPAPLFAALKAAGAAPLIAFGSHVAAAALDEALRSGADEAIPNSQFETRFRRLLEA